MAKSTTKTQAAAKTPARKTSATKLHSQRPMTTAAVVDNEDAAISSLLAELDGKPMGADEVMLETGADDVGDVRAGEVTGEDLSAALANVEATEQMVASATVEVADGTVTGDASDVVAEATPEGTDKPKKERVARVSYANKADRIAARLGDKLAEYTVLTVNDAAGAIDDAALAAKMTETMTLIRGMSQKKQNRAGFLMEFVSGKTAKLTEVMSRTLNVLHKDGVLTTGKEGNLLANLLARPYSAAAARAMGTNTVSVLEDLKLIVADGKGTYRANPDSLLLAKANALLGISTAG
jgi:hypothetical protein